MPVAKEEETHQPNRVLAGHCPSCKRVIVVFNNFEAWPLVKCKCGWIGATTKIVNRIRVEIGGVVKLGDAR